MDKNLKQPNFNDNELDNLMTILLVEYTKAVTNNINSLWLPRADALIVHLNEFRIKSAEDDLRQSLINLFDEKKD